MKNACCAWQAEVTDDSLKQMFEADEAYANGNVTKALSYLKSQTDHRLPQIEQMARSHCGPGKKYPTKMLQNDLTGIATMMATATPYEDVHKEVMRVDHKHALPAYHAFARCTRGK
jgi:hypothetical protein